MSLIDDLKKSGVKPVNNSGGASQPVSHPNNNSNRLINDLVRSGVKPMQNTPVTPAPVQTVTPQPVTPTPAPTPAPQTTTPSFLNNLFETLGIASQQAQRAVTGTFAPVETQQAENNRLAELGAARAGAAQERKRLEEIRAQVEKPQDTQPKPNARRDEILSEMRDMEANAGYITDEQTANEQEARWRELTQELRELDRSLGEPERDYTSTNAARDFASSWAQNYGNGIRATVGSLGQLGAEVGARLHDASSDEQRAVASSDYSGWATDELSAANIAAGTEAKTGAEIMADEKESSDRIFQKALEADKEQKAKLSRVLTGRTPLEQTALQVARTGLDVLSDTILSAMTAGVGGQLRMYGSVYGQGAMEQAEKGGDVYQRNLAGAKAALSALLSTKLLGGVETAYGKSVVGKASGNAIRKLAAKHPALANPITQRVIRSVTNTEGLEEGLEDILNYAGDRLLNLDRETPFDWDAWKQDMLIGHIIGSVASGVEFKPADFRLLVDEEVADAAGIVDDTPRTDTPIPPENASPYQQIAARHKSTIRAANDILRNPEALASFVEAHGELTGASNTERAGEIAAILRAEQTGTVQLAEPAQRGQEGQPPLVDRPRGMNGPTEAEANKQTSNRMADIILEVLRGETTPAKARQIVDNPTLRALYETVYGVQLPDSRAKAKQMVLDSEPNPEGEQALTEARAQAFTSPTSEPVETAPAQEATETPVEAAQPAGDIPAPPTTAESTTAQSQALNSAQQVPTQNTQGMNTENGVPPMPPQQPTGESTNPDYAALGKEYGVQEQGENPVRQANTPNRTAPGNRVSQSVNTVQEAAATPEARLPDIQAAVANGQFSFVPVSNDSLANEARSKIQKDGWATTLKNWTAAVRSGQANASLVAQGAVLMNNAANNPECTGAELIDLMLDYVKLNRTMGRGLQAARILKTLSPEGRLYAFQKTVQTMNEEAAAKRLGKKKGKGQTDPAIPETYSQYSIDPALIEEYRQQTTDEGRDEVIGKMQQAIADQIPSTIMDKFTALRYLNMLGNLKTQVRNVGGNTLMMLAQKVKNSIRAAIETVAQTATGGKYEKQYATFYGRDLYRAAVSDLKQTTGLMGEAMGDRKYSSPKSQYAKEIEDKRNVWKFGDNKLTRTLGIANKQGPLGWMMSKYSAATTWAMEMGDQIFVTRNYADGLAGYLKAHKITADQWSALVTEAEADPNSAAADTVDRARAFAIKQAQEATFRDTNKVSQFAQTFDQNWGKARVVTQGIAPFRKTPANVGVRMEEYSPLGLINTTVKAVQKAKGSENVTGADIVDSLSKTLTGSGLALLGFALAAHGRARTKSDDDKQEAFDKLRGLQDYSITVGGHNYTLDWAVPASASLFMGVELYNLTQDGDLSADDTMRIIGNLTSPMLEMSMLSGVNDALNNISSFNDDTDALPQFILNSAWSYLTQGMTNTLLGQLEQGSEEYRQTYYTDPENGILPTSAQQKLAKAGNKTPGVDFQSADYIDAWGRKQKNIENAGLRYLYSLASPAYINDVENQATPIDDELQRLYEATKGIPNMKSVLPKTPSRNTAVDGKRLSADEYETYAIEKGQKSLSLVEDFVNSKEYGMLDDEARAEIIGNLYTLAGDMASNAVAADRKKRGETEGIKLKDLPGDEDLPDKNRGQYVVAKKTFNTARDNKDYSTLDALIDTLDEYPKAVREKLYEDISRLDDMEAAAKKGVDSEEFTRAYDQYLAINKKDITPSDKAEEMKTWIRTSDLPKAKQDVLDDLLKYVSTSVVEAKTYDALREALGDPKMAQHFSHLKREEEANNAAEILSFVANDKEYQDAAVREKVLGTLLTEGQYAAYERAKAENISMGNWAKFLSEVSKAHVERTGKGGNPSKADIQAACNAMGWTTKADFDQVYKVYKGN